MNKEFLEIEPIEYIKKKKKKRFPPKPILKKCQLCGKRRVKYHHRLCPRCWSEKNVKI